MVDGSGELALPLLTAEPTPVTVTTYVHATSFFTAELTPVTVTAYVHEASFFIQPSTQPSTCAVSLPMLATSLQR